MFKYYFNVMVNFQNTCLNIVSIKALNDLKYNIHFMVYIRTSKRALSPVHFLYKTIYNIYIYIYIKSYNTKNLTRLYYNKRIVTDPKKRSLLFVCYCVLFVFVFFCSKVLKICLPTLYNFATN